MVEGGGNPAFPVVFFDGEREMNIGDVRINPTLEYKPFQHMISQKIGISPNQISIYLVNTKKSHRPPYSEDRRRIPITGRVNFGLICGQKDCCFLVVLKRSRKSRNRRDRMGNSLEFADFLPEEEYSSPPMHSVPEDMVLLRRNQQLTFHDQITQSELADLNDRLQSFSLQRDNYHMAVGNGNMNHPNFVMDPNRVRNISPDLVSNNDGRHLVPSATMMTTNNGIRKAFCGECVNAERNGRTASFHLCVNDPVVTRFNSGLGPIQRPKKSFS